MRNLIGQEIKLGSHVLMVSQGQGYTNMTIGTIAKISKSSMTIANHKGKNTNCQRPERLFVISQDEYDKHAEVLRTLDMAEAEWYAYAELAGKQKYMYRYSSDYPEYRDFINGYMNQKGYDDFLD